MGLMVLGWVGLQVLSGMLQGLVFFSSKANPAIHYFLNRFHLYSGIILLILAKTNVIIGWIAQKSTAGLVITAVAMAICLIILLSYIIWWRKQGSIAK